MELIIYILYSKSSRFNLSNYYKIKLNKKIGEGSYGYVYEINSDLVVKIFKNNSNQISDNSNNLIPNKNENRELNFFISYINSKYLENKHLIKIEAIASIKYFNIKDKSTNNYCIILPKCISVFKLINKWKMPLTKNKCGKKLVLDFMRKLLDIELFLNDKFNITNLDIKLNNYMINKNKDLDIKNIIAIDFGLTTNNNNSDYHIKKKYYIWPQGNVNLSHISSYSICINGLILFLGENNVKKLSINENLNFLKDDNDFYNIFYSGLLVKIKSSDLYSLIKTYMKNFKH